MKFYCTSWSKFNGFPFDWRDHGVLHVHEVDGADFKNWDLMNAEEVQIFVL